MMMQTDLPSYASVQKSRDQYDTNKAKPPPPHLPPRPSNENLAKKRVVSDEGGTRPHPRVKCEAPLPPVIPKPLKEDEIDSVLTIGTLVEVSGMVQNVCPYGVIRWIGYLEDKTKPIAGVEMVSTV